MLNTRITIRIIKISQAVWRQMKVECRQNWRPESTEEWKCVSIYVLPLCNVVPRPFIPRKGSEDQTQITLPAFFSPIVSSNFLIVCFSPPPFSHSAPLTPVPGSSSKHLFFFFVVYLRLANMISYTIPPQWSLWNLWSWNGVGTWGLLG